MNSHEYAELLQDPRWKTKRSEILRSRPRRCEDCGATGVRLDVHHGYYRPGRMPWDYPDRAFHLLCEGCHSGIHQAEPPARSMHRLIHAMAEKAKMPPRAKDMRSPLWDMARANERPGCAAQGLMTLLCWLYFKRGIVDLRLLEAITRIAASARNRYALLQPGGKAIESLIGIVSGERAADEKSEYMAADAAAGIGRRS